MISRKNSICYLYTIRFAFRFDFVDVFEKSMKESKLVVGISSKVLKSTIIGTVPFVEFKRQF